MITYITVETMNHYCFRTFTWFSFLSAMTRVHCNRGVLLQSKKKKQILQMNDSLRRFLLHYGPRRWLCVEAFQIPLVMKQLSFVLVHWGLSVVNEMIDVLCYDPALLRALLGREQPGLMRWIFIWIKTLVQDRSLDLHMFGEAAAT